MSKTLEVLLAKAKAGDESAAGRLLEFYRPSLLQIANKEIDPRLKRKVGGSDAVQQSLMEAGHSLRDFAGTTTIAFEAWLRRILLNNVANLRRHYQTDKRNLARERELSASALDTSKSGPIASRPVLDSSLITRREELSQIAKALEGLSATQRKVIQLRSHEKKSFQEIGECIGRSADATRKIWARAIESLKSKVDDGNRPQVAFRSTVAETKPLTNE